MQGFIALLALASLAPVAYADVKIDFCNTEQCNGSCSWQLQYPPNNGDGGCVQLGGIKSARALQYDVGYVITVYTDEWCTNNPTSVPFGKCIHNSKGWKSYSYDFGSPCA